MTDIPIPLPDERAPVAPASPEPPPAAPEAEIADLADYVLQPFTADERDAAEAMAVRAAEAIEVALRDGLGAAMARFNGAGKDA